MADRSAETTPPSHAISLAVLVVVGILAAGLLLLLGFGIDTLIAQHAVNVAKHDTMETIRAAQQAAQGKSKALCGALRSLATTPAAHKLHPIFAQVYNTTGCTKITGSLPPFHR